jgi:hypothetical protein
MDKLFIAIPFLKIENTYEPQSSASDDGCVSVPSSVIFVPVAVTVPSVDSKLEQLIPEL